MKQVAPGDSRVRLLLEPTEKETLTPERLHSPVRAACRALAEYIGARSIEVGGGRQLKFAAAYYDWPTYDDEAKLYPIVTVYQVGDATYDACSYTPTLTSYTESLVGRVDDSPAPVLLKVAEIEVMLVLEVTTNDPDARDALTLLVEDALNPVDWMAGARLRVPYYHGAQVDFLIESMNIDDDEGSARARLRRVAFAVSVSMPQYRIKGYPRATVRANITTRDE